MPWYFAGLDPDLARELDARNLQRGRFLDIGTGAGTQALGLAARGFDVTATDVSPSAIAGAVDRARTAGVTVDFRVDDVLESQLDQRFDFILDRGCFHVVPAERRRDYVALVRRLLSPGGLLFLKCFSDEDGGGGPYHFVPEDIHRIFDPHLRVEWIERTVIQGSLSVPPRALFCVMRG
jgi:cyclopropane fatty-acyl-phospholipid synthase-like methyltransferase